MATNVTMATSVTMASWTRVALLVLLLWCRTTAGFYFQMAGWKVVNGVTITVPSDGVYLVMMAADPHNNDRVDLRLRINSQLTAFVAYGSVHTIGGLTVAIPLNANDILEADPDGEYVSDSANRLAVVLVTSDKSAFRTMRMDREQWMDNTNSVPPFPKSLQSNGYWGVYDGNQHYIKVPSHGLYWLSARPDSGDRALTIHVKKKLSEYSTSELFKVFLSHADIALSASGAYKLSPDYPIFIESEDKPKTYPKRNLETGTILSFVKLTANTIIAEYAFTARVNQHGWYASRARLGFHYPITHLGRMYNKKAKTFSIRKAGVYVVSMRGDPDATGSLVLLLMRNDVQIFRSFAEGGTPSGQDGVFKFDQGDTISVTADNEGSEVDKATLFSIAFVASE